MSVAAVPLPAVRDPVIAQSPVEGLVRECDDVMMSERRALLCTVVGLIRKLLTPLPWLLWWEWMPCRWEMMLRWIVYTNAQHGIVVIGVRQLMTVYYGSDLCDSNESDWEDPYDIASAEYVEQYNFDVPEGMDLMVF